jgi:hypothetical protein
MRWSFLPHLGPVLKPVLTLGLFVGCEVIAGNVLEPWLFGAKTGVSALAILVAAVFWAWLWGAIGLLLSTPLTVCLAVMGKYVPQMQFLDVLLGDQPVLEPYERYYQRLLAEDPEEAEELIEEMLKTQSVEQVYETTLIPALRLAADDATRGHLDEGPLASIVGSIKEQVEALREQSSIDALKRDSDATVELARGDAANSNDTQTKPASSSTPAEDSKLLIHNRVVLPRDCTVNIVIFPAHDLADEIVGLMLAHALEIRGYCAYPVSQDALASEMLEIVEKVDAHVACVSALPPGAVTHSRYLCKRLHRRFPNVRMVVGLWTTRMDLGRAKSRIACKAHMHVVATLENALDQIHQLIQPNLVPKSPAVDRDVA